MRQCEWTVKEEERMFLFSERLGRIKMLSPDSGGGGGEGSLNNNLPNQQNRAGEGEGEGEGEDTDSPEIDIEMFKRFAVENADAQVWIQQQNQSQIDKGVQTQLEKEIESVRANAIAEAQNLTPEAIRISELEKRVADSERQRQQEANKTSALTMIAGMEGVPKEALPHLQSFVMESLITDSAEQSTRNLQNLNTVIGKVIKSVERDSIHTKVDNFGNRNVQPQRKATETSTSNTERTMSQSREAGDILDKILG